MITHLSLNHYKWTYLLLFFLFFTIITSKSQVVCPGTYDGHLQGIITDETGAIYWSFNADLAKTDEEGNLLVTCNVPGHHGDLTYHDGKIYVAVNLGEFNKKDYAKSWVYVYDSESFELISKYHIPELEYGAGGIEYYKERFFVVGGLPEGHKQNYVYEYDREFRLIQKHTIESGYTLLGIQTVCHAQGYWWFGCYGETPVVLKTDDAFNLKGKYDFHCFLGICRFTEDSFLIGRLYDENYNRGQVLVAKTDSMKGLVLTQK